MAGGIRIEPYQPLGVRTPAVPGGGYIQVDASAGDFGQSLGKGLQQGAAQLKELGAQLKERASREAEALARDADVAADAEDRPMLWDPKTGYYMKRGRAAVAAAPVMMKALDDNTARAAATLEGNTEALSLFKRIRAARVRGLSDSLASHSSRESMVWQDESAQSRSRLAIDTAALHWQDDKKLALHYNVGLRDVISVSEDKGDAPETTQFKAREYASKFHAVSILAAVETDPVRAKAILDRHLGVLTAQDRVTVEKRVNDRLVEHAGASVAIAALTPGATGGYQNNVGNIVKSQFGYAGGKGPGHGNFETFDTPEHGVAAAYITVQAKAKQNGGALSFADLIAGNGKVQGWAPADTSGGTNPMLRGNDPQSYATRLSAAIGLKPGDAVPLADDAKMAVVLAEMNRIEKGRVTVPDGAFLGGIQLARGGGQPPAQRPGTVPAQLPTQADIVRDALAATRNLPIEAQQKAVTTALTVWRGQVEAETKRQAAAEHDLKLRGEAASKDLLDLYQRRELKVEDVQRAKPLLSEPLYKSYLALANGQGGYDDVATVADLEGRLHREDVRGAAASALANKQISIDRFTSIMGRNEAYLKDNQPSSPYKRNRDFVDKLLDPGILGDPQAQAIGRAAVANALRDYDTFVLANPKLDPKEADVRLKAVADDLVGRYATVQIRDMSIALPMPRFVSFTKKADMTTAPAADVMTQITNAARQLQVELDANRISPTEAAREAEVLKSWTSITQRRLAQPPTTTPKR